MLELSPSECLDLIEACIDAQDELCCGEGFNEANAYYDRLEKLKLKLMKHAKLGEA